MTITRRAVLASTALAAAPIGGSRSWLKPPPQRPSAAAGRAARQAPGFYRYKVGDIEVTAINDGFARRPLEGFVRNAELAQVQQAMQEAFLPADALPITFTTLVLQQNGRLTLIDTGNGDMGAPTSGTLDDEFPRRRLRSGPGRHGRDQPFPWRPHQRPAPEGRHGRLPECRGDGAGRRMGLLDGRCPHEPGAGGHEGRLPGRAPRLRPDRQGREALRGRQGGRAGPDRASRLPAIRRATPPTCSRPAAAS